jgi:hypothetical protein
MANIAISLTPLEVPTIVVLQVPTSGNREDGFKPCPTIAINSLPHQTVIDLCSEFQATMLKRWEEAQRPRAA